MDDEHTQQIDLTLEQRMALAGYLPYRGTAIDLMDIRILREDLTLTTTEIETMGVDSAQQITVQMARDSTKTFFWTDNQMAVVKRLLTTAEQKGDLADCLLEFFQKYVQGSKS